jgi:FAD/FMN-containing dehydrogenase
MADAASVAGALQASIGGKVSRPGESGYDEATSIWNGSISRQPSIVASCTTSADVSAALRAAIDNGLEISIRGGGHNYAGFALTDGGLMIDLTPMKSVSVDAATKRARCGGGVTWGELDAATQQHNLAVPGGFISRTGVAGLTLGGGLGWLSRLAGLTADNLVAAEVGRGLCPHSRRRNLVRRFAQHALRRQHLHLDPDERRLRCRARVGARVLVSTGSACKGCRQLRELHDRPR